MKIKSLFGIFFRFEMLSCNGKHLWSLGFHVEHCYVEKLQSFGSVFVCVFLKWYD